MLKLIILSCLVACVICQYRSTRRSSDSFLLDGILGDSLDSGLDLWGSDLLANDLWDLDLDGNDWRGRRGGRWRNRRGRFGRRGDRFNRRGGRINRRGGRFNRFNRGY